jgi:hypothetical protein
VAGERGVAIGLRGAAEGQERTGEEQQRKAHGNGTGRAR